MVELKHKNLDFYLGFFTSESVKSVRIVCPHCGDFIGFKIEISGIDFTTGAILNSEQFFSCISRCLNCKAMITLNGESRKEGIYIVSMESENEFQSEPHIIVNSFFDMAFALDFHSITSSFIGYKSDGSPDFETKRTVLGEMLYQLKYRGKKKYAENIARILSSFIEEKKLLFESICVVPATTRREKQPVALIAEKLSGILKIPFIDCLCFERTMPKIKDISDPEKRVELLQNSIGIRKCTFNDINGTVLLLDDLYRSGSTASEAARVLRKDGVKKIILICVTRTRIAR